jgi:hypothetical protein
MISRKMTNGKLNKITFDSLLIIIKYLNFPLDLVCVLLTCPTIYSIEEHLTKKDTKHFELIKIDNFEDLQKAPKWVIIKYHEKNKQITDVSALGNVHTLGLHWCENVTDVSALGNVHTLNLLWCRKVTDVSALGNVHTLNLS